MTTNRAIRQDEVARPRVIVSAIATTDGRVTLSRTGRLLDEGPNRRWRTTWPPDTDELLAQRSATIEQRHHPTVILEGSGSFVADDNGPLELPETNTATEELWNDFLPCHSTRWFAVVDGRGRVAWTHKGDAETSLLVITSQSTPLPYLAYLRRERIPYLLAGADRVDLEALLVKIRKQLGAECLVSEAGGGLNGALLRAGLVDELHVITIPALVGGLGTPSIMDGPPLEPGSVPVPLQMIDVKVGAQGTIYAHYDVVGGHPGG
jgi:2,5-diamino-6-(ribosylamino)-4(3H)-pyrimidinone 5'-phosphate reductase